MATRILNVLLRTALLAAVVASVVLFVDYRTSASPAFCGGEGGCAAVRASPFSHIGPVSLPAIGMGAFIGLFALSVWASRRRHFLALTVQTGLAALVAAVLIGLQLFVVKAVCPWCMVVDVGALVSFALALTVYRRAGDELAEPTPLRVLWTAAGFVVVAVPMLWDYTAAANVVTVPDAIAKYQEPGKVNVVMFTDFECPHCERLHDAMEAERPALGERLNLVRLMNPLEFHAGAKPAALAYLCMPEAEREQAADRFYKADNAELTPQGVVKIGESLGADPKALSACMADPKTLRQIQHDQALFHEAGLSGVPTTYVGAELVKGADLVAFRSAIDRARGGDGGGSSVVWMFVFIGLIVGAVAAVSLRAATRSDDAA